MTDPTKVGLAISGRNPGFTVFYKREWNGMDPQDKNYKEFVEADSAVYYTVQLGRDYDVYEYALCNYSAGTRRDAFRIAMQVPSDRIILNATGNNVSPKFLLDEIAKAVIEKCLVKIGQTYSIPENVIRPNFAIPEIETILGQYVLAQRWGAPVVMNLAGPQVFVNIEDALIGPAMKAATGISRLSADSLLVLGKFKDDMLARAGLMTEILTEAEIMAPPKVEARVKDASGRVAIVTLGATPVEFASDKFGYSPVCYKPVFVALTAQNVLDAATGRQPLPAVPGVQMAMYAPEGFINIAFMPQEEMKDFVVKVSEARKRQVDGNAILSHLILNFEGKQWGMERGQFTLTGPQILNFESLAGRLGDFKDNFVLNNPDYILKNVRLSGGELIVEVEEKPKPKPARNLNGPVAGGAVAGTASDWKSVKILLPSAANAVTYPVSVYFMDAARRRTLVRRQEVTFVPVKNTLTGTVSVPWEKDAMSAVVEVGSPAIFRGTTVYSNEEGNMVDFTDRKKGYGAFARFMESMQFSNSAWYAPAYRTWRWLVVVVVILLVFLIGFVVGALAEHGLDLASRISPVEQVNEADRPQPEAEEPANAEESVKESEIQNKEAAELSEDKEGEPASEESENTENSEDPAHEEGGAE